MNQLLTLLIHSHSKSESVFFLIYVQIFFFCFKLESYLCSYPGLAYGNLVVEMSFVMLFRKMEISLVEEEAALRAHNQILQQWDSFTFGR